jgi:hypothetical protein
VKKYQKLYNRMWEALHADDKFVVANKRTHEENVRRMVAAMREVPAGAAYARYFGPLDALAEACLDALILDDAEG